MRTTLGINEPSTERSNTKRVAPGPQSARVDDVEKITTEHSQAMLELLADHFEGVDPDVFMTDLSSKDQVLSLYDQRMELCGFTSFAYERLPVGGDATDSDRGSDTGGEKGVIYSGDTIMRPDSWNSSLLMPVWIRAVHAQHKRRGGGDLFWLLLSAGFRTYRFLPILFQQFEPSFASKDCQTAPPGFRRALAERRYGDSLVADLHGPSLDIVRFDLPHRLRGELAGIPEARRNCPHVQFFMKANPGHEQGDELVCLADLGLENLTSAGRRMWQRGGRLLATGPSPGGHAASS